MSMQGNFQSPWSSQTGLEFEGSVTELEPLGELAEGFEPQTRARSNTWPLPRPENYVDPAEDCGSKKNSNHNLVGAPPLPSSAVTSKKNSSRRNAWGNLSYADLITQAITSAQENRLTLAQIYEWMIQNVPYFKDKGDSNSSAGWKNSIRHNLSLHNRFMRVQNEGTGKSSWWMINPDAKPGKAVRRRAASMETSKFEKRRGRVKKKSEVLRNGIQADTTPSPSSSISESLDRFPDSPVHSFQLSPDFRQRASSNASSCGRLSPIPSLAATEPDWEYAPGDYAPNEFPPAEQLAGSLADAMKLQGDPFLNTYVPTTMSCGVGGAVGVRFPYGCSAGFAPRDRFVPPAPPAAHPSDAMRTDSQVQLSRPNAGMPQGSMAPTTVMGQIMGALNTGLAEDLNIESLDHGFECNVDEVIKHELSMEGTLDFNFPQQHQAVVSEAQYAAPAPAPPAALPDSSSSGRTQYTIIRGQWCGLHEGWSSGA